MQAEGLLHTTLSTNRISIPNIVFIVFDLVFRQQLSEFILKRDGLVVILLLVDVSDQLIQLRRPN
jgi:hypothetical protein